MSRKREVPAWKSKEAKTIQKRISKIRGKTPQAVREESWRYKRVKARWRKPKGIDSKMRKKKAGRHPLPNIGRRTPRNLRNRHPLGLYEVLVNRVEDLKSINPQTHLARIAGGVGSRKRADIVEEAKKLNIKILNPNVKTKPKSEEEKGEGKGEKAESEEPEETEGES
jgi:large subunit ribosomal protein L32e